jgi:hypothetical protein
MIIGGLDEVGRFIIYGLCDPRTGELRYVGKSSQGLRRAKNHVKESDLRRHGRTHKTAWIRSLLKLGLRPKIIVIKECQDAQCLYEEEQNIIAFYRKMNARLVNSTDGGPGRFGYKLSDETKEKIRSAARRQTPVSHSAETKQFLRALQLGRKHSLDARSNMSAAHGGRPFRDLSTGKIYLTQQQAADELGLHQTKIGAVLAGKRRTTGGREFAYV